LPFATIGDALIDVKTTPKASPQNLIDWKTKQSMYDASNSSLDGFSKPTATEERHEIIDSLIGSLEDFPFLEQPDVKFELPRNWELMDP